MDKTTSEIFFGGGARSGKSYLLSAFVVIYSLMYPGISIGVCRYTLSSLKKTTLVSIFEFMDSNNMKEGEHYKFNRQDLILEFKNGSRLYFLELTELPGDPNFERLMSLGLTAAVIDEVSQISSNAINKLSTRLSHKLKEYDLIPKLLLVSNPTTGYLKDTFYTPFREDRLPHYRKVILSNVYDNKYVDKSYIKTLKNLDNSTVQRLLYGNWDYAEEDYNLFKYDDIVQCFYNNNVNLGTMYLSCDVSNMGKDKTCITIWNGMRLEKVFLYDKTTTIDVVNLIKNKMSIYNVKIKNVIVDADGLGVGVYDILKGCVGFKGGSSPLYKENYSNLRTQCYYKLSQSIMDIGMDDEMKEDITKELMAIRINPNDGLKIQLEKKDKIKQRLGRSPDIADSLMMKMFFNIKKPSRNIMIY